MTTAPSRRETLVIRLTPQAFGSGDGFDAVHRMAAEKVVVKVTRAGALVVSLYRTDPDDEGRWQRVIQRGYNAEDWIEYRLEATDAVAGFAGVIA